MRRANRLVDERCHMMKLAGRISFSRLREKVPKADEGIL